MNGMLQKVTQENISTNRKICQAKPNKSKSRWLILYDVPEYSNFIVSSSATVSGTTTFILYLVYCGNCGESGGKMTVVGSHLGGAPLSLAFCKMGY